MSLHNVMRMRSRTSGFSLIEAMVSVVVLATGLLALAAMQGALAKNAADAKARGAIMAALTSRMNEIRQAPPSVGKTWTMTDAWVKDAAAQAGASDLKVVETITTMNWNGTDFVSTAVTNPPASFTRALLVATWSAASGDSKTLALSSDISGTMYGAGGYPVPDPSGSAAKRPIVRQQNPSNTPGVIPIVSGDQATAASNPQPLKIGSGSNSLQGTSFDVLNYIPENATGTAVLTKRFQTEVIKCRCAYGAGGGYSVAGEAQWPAIWDGTTYTTYPGTGAPAGKAAKAGQDPAYVGKQANECTECCRDHHDDAGNSKLESRFDPEATAVGKYNETNGVLSALGAGDTKYVDSCRLVKLDGMWKTTADYYARQFGMLETQTDTSFTPARQAGIGLPTEAAKNSYTQFVKDYLATYTGSSTTAPAGAQAMYEAAGLKPRPTVEIAAPSTTDNRYLHVRGLYVDYLGKDARNTVASAIENCVDNTPAALAECILPVLPFTTVNLTELARWLASDSSILNVNSTMALDWDVDQPSGGRTNGLKVGSADSIAKIYTSNSGLAASGTIKGAVDNNGDLAELSDSQTFNVGGTSTTTPGVDAFHVELVGGGDVPSVRSSLASDGCKFNAGLGRWVCQSASGLPQTATVTLSSYFKVQQFPSEKFNFPADVCVSTNGNKVFNGGYLALPGGGLPKLIDQNVTSVSVNGSPLAGTWPASSGGGTAAEVTQIPGLGILKANPSETVVTITVADSGTTVLPTVKSCTFKESNVESIVSVEWNEPWAPSLK